MTTSISKMWKIHEKQKVKKWKKYLRKQIIIIVTNRQNELKENLNNEEKINTNIHKNIRDLS